MRWLHNLLTDLDFEWCDKGETGRPIGCFLCVYASVCECVSGRMCQTEGCDVFTSRRVQVHCLKPLSYPPPFIFFFFLFSIILSSLCLSADNMVDQTKVETSEAKASELEKKVKRTQNDSC